MDWRDLTTSGHGVPKPQKEPVVESSTIYELICDVENPQADRRYRGNLALVPTWKKGQKLICDVKGETYPGEEGLVYRTVVLRFCGVQWRGWLTDEQVKALAPAMVKSEPTVKDALAEATWPPKSILQALERSGKITIEDIIAADKWLNDGGIDEVDPQ